MSIKDFRGQVKISDVQDAFDEIVNRINGQVDLYNSLYDLEDYDLTKGSALLGAPAYTLTVGGLKSVLSSYDGTIIGCKVIKVSDTRILVTDGLYITSDGVTRITQREVDVDSIPQFETEGNVTIDDDTHVASITSDGGYIYSRSPFYGVDPDSVNSFKFFVSYVPRAIVSGGYPEAEHIWGCTGFKEGLNTNVTATQYVGNGILERYFYFSVNSIGYSTSSTIQPGVKSYLRIEFTKGTGYTIYYSPDGSTWTTSTVATADFVLDAIESSLMTIGSAGSSSIYLDECYLEINGETAWTPYNITNQAPKALYYNTSEDTLFTRSDSTYTAPNVIKVCDINWNSDNVVLNSYDNVQLEGKDMKISTQSLTLPYSDHIVMPLSTSNGGKFVSFLSRMGNESASNVSNCNFMNVNILNTYKAGGNYRAHWQTLPVSMIYIPNGFNPEISISGLVGQYVYDYTLTS